MNFHDARAAADGPTFAFQANVDHQWAVACDTCRIARRVPNQETAEHAAATHIHQIDRPIGWKRRPR